jgi:parallel beta-helix repeat protein
MVLHFLRVSVVKGELREMREIRLRANRLSGNGYLAQGNNFGIGFVAAADTGNIVEDNTVLGNLNGIFLAAGVQGNTFLRNLITGNPPIQMSFDTPSSTIGYDIKNLADPDANTFEGNVGFVASGNNNGNCGRAADCPAPTGTGTWT